MNDELLRYPIGRFTVPESYTSEATQLNINIIKTLPVKLRNAIIKLTDAQQNTPYRPGGWTLKQVVHHLADSHMNALLRIKLTLTEDNPAIKPYRNDQWALQPDYRLPVESSLKMLEGIHQHLIALFESFSDAEWQRTHFHPEMQRTRTLYETLAQYAWHSEHHLAHITGTMKQWGL